jgi:D-alanyl-lipoteichoic acid acyltransferase DltB (MBOAT superfamily)
MLFNSLDFAVFIIIVFLIYWFIVNKNLKHQNGFLLLASYFFYGFWDWRFLLLLIIVSLINYFIGIEIDKSLFKKRRKTYLLIGLVINIGILGVFKYYNFFIDSFIDFLSLFGYHLQRSSTRILLPLGISFYTFLSLSYIIDIYKKNLSADSNIIDVLLTLSFFPIILAGPIQRPSTLLPQIAEKRKFEFENAVDGLRQILWGLFVKIAIADNIATPADDIFQNFSHYSGSTLLLGAVLYSIQIYADFSGYSNIAIGTAKLFGFNLMRNFDNPYFSRDITEFWKKWHISLTTWFRDYVFLPISFAVSWNIKEGKEFYISTSLLIYIIASIITWFLTGLWHGANYTFLVWGMIHGGFLIFYQWQRKPRKKLLKSIGISNNNRVIVIFESAITLFVVLIAWIFFRSDSVHNAIIFLGGISSKSLFSRPDVFPKVAMIFSVIFILIEYIQRQKQHALQMENIKSGAVRWGIYLGIIFLILFFGGGDQKFIYFQF